MNRITIDSYQTLIVRKQQLLDEKVLNEAELKVAFTEFVSTLNPVSIVKSSIRELSTDKEVQFDLVKVGLNFGTNLLINQVLGKRRSIKGFLSSVLVEKFSTPFINHNASKIIGAIASLFHKKEQE